MNKTKNSDSGSRNGNKAQAESYQSTRGGRSGCEKFKSHDERMTVVTPAGISIEGVSFQQAVAITRSMETLYGVGIQMNTQEIPSKPTPSPNPKSLKDHEIAAIRKALLENHGNKAATARALRIARNTLDRKMETYGIEIQKSVA